MGVGDWLKNHKLVTVSTLAAGAAIATQVFGGSGKPAAPVLPTAAKAPAASSTIKAPASPAASPTADPTLSDARIKHSELLKQHEASVAEIRTEATKDLQEVLKESGSTATGVLSEQGITTARLAAQDAIKALHKEYTKNVGDDVRAGADLTADESLKTIVAKERAIADKWEELQKTGDHLRQENPAFRLATPALDVKIDEVPTSGILGAGSNVDAIKKAAAADEQRGR